MKEELAITAQYEPAISPPACGPLVAFAEEAWRLAHIDPLALCNSVAGRTSTAASGMLLPTGTGAGAPPIRLASISLGQEKLLRRTYDPYGRLTSVEYPDKQRVDYVYGQDGQPELISIGVGVRIKKSWDDLGNLVGAELNSGTPRLQVQRAGGGAVRGITFGSDILSCLWSAGRLAAVRLSDNAGLRFDQTSPSGSPQLTVEAGNVSAVVPMASGDTDALVANCPGRLWSYLASALGLIRLDKNGRVAFWLQPDGNPVWFGYDRGGAISQAWTTAGVLLSQPGDGQSSAIVNPAGERFLFREVAAGSWAIIGPDAVSLVSRDANGRFRSILGMWGDSTVFRYGLLKRCASPVRIVSSKWGETRIRYAAGNRPRCVTITGKGQVGLHYRKDGLLTKMSLEGATWEGILPVLKVAGLLYVLRSAGGSDFGLPLLWGQYLA